MTFDALLRFHDPLVEAAFWVSVRDSLCTLDQLTTVLVVCNNAIHVAVGHKLMAAGLAEPRLYVFFITYTVFMVISQLVIAWLATYHRQAYYRRRDFITAGTRLQRYVLAAILTVVTSRGNRDTGVTGFLLSHSSSMFMVLLRAFAHRGVLFWAHYYAVFWPLRFPLHALLHTMFMLPLLLHCASCLARDVLSHASLQQPVCNLASQLAFLVSQRSGCLPQAPQLVAYSVSARLRLRCCCVAQRSALSACLLRALMSAYVGCCCAADPPAACLALPLRSCSGWRLCWLAHQPAPFCPRRPAFAPRCALPNTPSCLQSRQMLQRRGVGPRLVRHP